MNTEPEIIAQCLPNDWRQLWGMSAPPAPLTLEQRQARDDALRRASIRTQRLDRFRALCPPLFLQQIDRANVPNLAAWDEADAWPGSHPGIWLWSPETGEAKTHPEQSHRITKAEGYWHSRSHCGSFVSGHARSCQSAL